MVYLPELRGVSPRKQQKVVCRRHGRAEIQTWSCGEELIDVVNLKCNTVLVGSLLCESGFFPAYHMSKGSWITVALDDTVPDDKIKMLLDMSYHLTYKINKPKIQRKK